MKKKQRSKQVFIRTVTHYYTGRVVEETAREIVLDLAAWIADTGRFSEAMRTGSVSKVEPYPDGVLVRVQRGAIVDICDWPHALLRVVK